MSAPPRASDASSARRHRSNGSTSASFPAWASSTAETTSDSVARAVADAFVRHWDDHAAVLRVRNLKAEEGDRAFRKLRQASLSPVVERLAKKVEEHQEVGRVSTDLSPWAAASSLIAARISAFTADFFGFSGCTGGHIAGLRALVSGLLVEQG